MTIGVSLKASSAGLSREKEKVFLLASLSVAYRASV